MAVVTIAEYKTLSGITTVDATRDARITALIPQVEEDIISYCNNTFRNRTIGLATEVVPTVESGPVYSFVGTNFTDEPFTTGDTLEVVGTVRNDGRYTIVTITATKITVLEPVVAEASVDVELYLIQFPVALELYATRMIAYQLNHMADAGLNSETIKTYKYTRQEKDSFFYPKEILTGLDKWAYVGVVRRSKLTHYNENRATFIAQRLVE